MSEFKERIVVREKIVDLIVSVRPAIHGEFNDWPAQLQDHFYKAIENYALKTMLPWTILSSHTGVDPDTGPFAHVVISAIVVVN